MKTKEWCIHLIDNQGNTYLEIDDIQAKNYKQAIKEAKEKFFGEFGLEVNKVCENCNTDNYYMEKICENCESKL